MKRAYLLVICNGRHREGEVVTVMDHGTEFAPKDLQSYAALPIEWPEGSIKRVTSDRDFLLELDLTKVLSQETIEAMHHRTKIFLPEGASLNRRYSDGTRVKARNIKTLALTRRVLPEMVKRKRD